MRLLNKEDFKGFNFKTNQSGIDMLADVCGVALEVFEQEKRRRLKGKEILIQHRSSSSPPSSLLKSYDQKENESKAAVVTAGDDQIVHGLKLRIPKPTTITSITMAPPQKRSRNNQKMMKQQNDDEDDDDDDDDDDDGDDWDIQVTKNSKKSSKRKRRPSNFVRRPAPADPASYPELPGEFRREIEAMAGTEITLVIQKELYETDLKPYHNRLSIPFTQIINWDFLTKAEKDTLRRQEVIEDVPLLIKEAAEERMEVMNINLRQWNMAKQSGKTSYCYVLRTSWQQVAKSNGLNKNDVVQVWSFRVGHRLHLALVVVSRANQLPMANSGSTSTGAGSSGSSGNNASGSSGSSGSSNIATV